MLATSSCASVTREEALRLGTIAVVPASGPHRGVVLGAPHGTYDLMTDRITERLAQRLGLAAVIATGFTGTQTGGVRINVNRPTEGARLASADEPVTARARLVWEQYRRSLLDAAGGQLTGYIEVHGHGGSDIEVATVGLTADDARRIKKLYEEAVKTAVGTSAAMPRAAMRVEPEDTIRLTARASKTRGSLALAKKALHLEFPLEARRLAVSEDAPYLRVLEIFLRRALAEVLLER